MFTKDELRDVARARTVHIGLMSHHQALALL
jgi:hypothetical protein